MSTATKDDTTTTETAAPPEWVRRTTPLTDKMRADRAAKYPNPQTVNIDALIAAVKAEYDAAPRTANDAWSYLHGVHVANARGQNCNLTAEYEQWDSEAKAYTRWVRNPRLGDVTEVPVADLFARFKTWVRDYRTARVHVDNICGALGLTYAPSVTTYDVSLNVTVTEQMIADAGHNVDYVGTDLDSNRVREYLSLVLRNWLRDNYSRIEYKVTATPTTPTA